MHRPQIQPPTREWLDRARATARTAHAALVPDEGPAEHLRNCLAIVRFTIEHDDPILGNGCPAVAVPITSLARIQARLEVVLEQLEPVAKDEPDYRHPDVQCTRGRGTILPPTNGGVPRGTCPCPRDPGLDRVFSQDR